MDYSSSDHTVFCYKNNWKFPRKEKIREIGKGNKIVLPKGRKQDLFVKIIQLKRRKEQLSCSNSVLGERHSLIESLQLQSFKFLAYAQWAENRYHMNPVFEFGPQRIRGLAIVCLWTLKLFFKEHWNFWVTASSLGICN